MSENPPILMWFRRDLRLSDHPALTAAVALAQAEGRAVIPVFLHDECVEVLGAAPRFRLGLGLAAFDAALRDRGSRLILRRGPALRALQDLIDETGARDVIWSRAYDAPAIARDSAVKAALKAAGIGAQSHPGQMLFEPWDVETGSGGFYRVYTPFWKALRDRDIADPAPAPAHIPAPEVWPASDRRDDWRMDAAMARGRDIVAPHCLVGEAAAQGRLGAFVAHGIARYDSDRDLPGRDGTSRLSQNLALGEIGPRSCWHAARRAHEEGKPGAETWMKELVWRDFAGHLAYHTPHILTENWKPDWDAFPWATDPDAPEVTAWKRGRTGIRFVDAAMREMYVTGTMHNRARMIVASYLTKHLMTHWRIGLDWFADCLVDWDPASNAMGWQWAAGSGPDAAPYFRVFNPVSQLEKFDRDHAYQRAWIAEGQGRPPAGALAYFDAVPLSWNMAPTDPYPDPVVTAEAGRKRALDAYANRGF